MGYICGEQALWCVHAHKVMVFMSTHFMNRVRTLRLLMHVGVEFRYSSSCLRSGYRFGLVCFSSLVPSPCIELAVAVVRTPVVHLCCGVLPVGLFVTRLSGGDVVVYRGTAVRCAGSDFLLVSCPLFVRYSWRWCLSVGLVWALGARVICSALRPHSSGRPRKATSIEAPKTKAY